MEKNLNEINPKLYPNDRIVLIHMDDYYPVPFLSKGVVDSDSLEYKKQQPKYSKNDCGYAYKVAWYDQETGEPISTLPLMPDTDSWLYDKEYYESNTDSLNESMFDNVDDIIRWGDFLNVFSKSELEYVCEFFELERRTGFFNMVLEGGKFLLVGSEFIKDYIKLKSHETEFDTEDKDIHNALISRAEKVRVIFISNAMELLENNDMDTEIDDVKHAMIKLAKLAKEYWVENANKFLDKEIE